MIAALRSRLRPASVLFALWLLVMWILVWGSLSLANIVSGLVAVSVVLVAVPREAPTGGTPIVRPLAALGLLGWFTWKVVEANVIVAIEVLRPPSRSRIRNAIVCVPLPGCPPAIATMVANGITLTPGTLTVDVDPSVPTLAVHVLQLDSPDAVRADVYDLERRVVEAIGSAPAREAILSRGADA